PPPPQFFINPNPLIPFLAWLVGLLFFYMKPNSAWGHVPRGLGPLFPPPLFFTTFLRKCLNHEDFMEIAITLL
ncbi:hypothetical protein, partial [Enterobacter hormaechei]|uniref:hypothetical protein n=1 Tax=Enterobacter hormaechei TaxID=158836 RepID=UPI003D6E7B25